MSKHTPGPWNAERTGFRWSIVDASGELVLSHYGSTNSLDDATMMASKTGKQLTANARLLASAPDLLDALECLHADLGRLPPKVADIVRAAIAKAVGK